jgi:circadian clock protein KaiC
MVSQKPSVNDLASTGIEALDMLLSGGLPRNRLYLLEGGTGTGKTTFGLQFALAGVRQGERVLYVTLSETEEELREIAASHDWRLDDLEIYEFQLTEEQQDPGGGYTLFHSSEMEAGESMERLLQCLEQIQPTRLVLDTISGLRILADDPLYHRRQIQMLRHYLGKRRCTALLLDEALTSTGEVSQAHIIAHGVITLERLVMTYGNARRRLHIHKLRGVEYLDSYHDYRIVRGGIKIYPRLVPQDHQQPNYRPKSNLLGSGIPALDTLLGGGLARGYSTLLMGPAGTGKSTLSSQYAAAAAEQGERSLIFVFEEPVEHFIERAESIGIALKKHVDSGHVIIELVYSTDLSPGEFWNRVRHHVQQQSIQLVVFDSLSGYLQAMPEERYLSLHFQELLTYLNHQGMVTILTIVQSGVLGMDLKAPFSLSTIADTIILLRYFESKGELHKALSILKHRTGPHALSIHELRMDRSGVQLSQQLQGFQGILTGVPEYGGSSGPRLSEGN